MQGKKLIIPLYKGIVRPHLEYCIQAWRPYCKKGIDMLEQIQRIATTMNTELRDISYETRLKELTTIETRRLRGDQIEVLLFSHSRNSRTREHEVTLVNDRCRLDISVDWISQRTVSE